MFPLKNGSKQPAVKWEQYLTGKPTEQELSEWKAAGYENYAVVCGAVSNNLVILDFESPDDAKAFFSGWDKLLEQTLVVATPHGGYHVYFILDKAPPRRKIRIFGNEHPVDLLGEGGYAVAPGSVIICPQGDCNHRSYGTYEIVSKATEPTLLPETEFMATLIRRAKELGWSTPVETGTKERAAVGELSETEITEIARILSNYWVKGSRNALTIRLCGALIHNGVGIESAKAIVQRVGELAGDEELSERIKTVEYEYQPRTARKEKLLGLPSLLEQMKEINPERALSDFNEIAQIIAPPEKEQAPVEIIVNYLLHEYEIVTMRDSGEIYVKENGIYKNDPRYLEQVIQTEFADKKIRNHTVDEILGQIKRNTYKSRSFFEMAPELIPLKNGVLNVATGEFRPYSESDHFITCLPVEYDPNADAPLFKKFVSEIVYPGDIATLQEMFGYTLWRDMPAQVAFMLVGEGANGKSTLLAILKALLGEQNVTAFAIQELETERFLKGALYGKLANIRSELPSAALKDTGVFKHLTGGDPITTDVKYGTPFTFVNYAKLIFATNKIPKTPDDTDAFFRRWIIISFPFKFVENPNPAAGEKKADPTLAQKIIERELPGVFNWALAGLRRLIANGWVFSNGKTTEETRADYIRKSDPIKAFINDALELGNADAETPKAELYQAFIEYCKQNKLNPVSDESFFKGLSKNGIDISKTIRKEINGVRKLYLKGVALKPRELWGKTAEELESGAPAENGSNTSAPAQPNETPPGEQNETKPAPTENKQGGQEQAPYSNDAEKEPIESGAPEQNKEPACGKCIYFESNRCLKHPERVFVSPAALYAKTCEFYKERAQGAL